MNYLAYLIETLVVILFFERKAYRTVIVFYLHKSLFCSKYIRDLFYWNAARIKADFGLKGYS